MERTALAGLLTPTAYRETRQHVFPSEGSLSWALRQHRDRLVQAGALVKLGGALLIVESPFDAVMLEVGQEAAKRHGVAS